MRPVTTPVRARRERCTATLSSHPPTCRQPLDGSTDAPLPPGPSQDRLAPPTTPLTVAGTGARREHGVVDAQHLAPNAVYRKASGGTSLASLGPAAAGSVPTSSTAAATPAGGLPGAPLTTSAAPLRTASAVPAARSPAATAAACATGPTASRFSVTVSRPPGGGPPAGAAALDGHALGHVLRCNGLGDLPHKGVHGVVVGTDALDVRTDPRLLEQALQSCFCSGRTRVMTLPAAPARAVRPERCR